MSPQVSVLKIGLSPSLAGSAPEAYYALRTLARIAGYATEFAWADDREGLWDIYWGPATASVRARVRIDALADVRRVDGAEPRTFHTQDDIGFIDFDGERRGFTRESDGSTHFRGDIVATCYWLLTGTREPHYRRDRHGSAYLDDTFLQRHGLLARPLVSEYASFLRAVFRDLGLEPRPLPWTEDKRAAFLFTHDVDYPQMIRWVECLRLTRQRGFRALPLIRDVLGGRSHFWKFADWIGFEDRFGVRPAFFFSARQGSLWEYATGTPDCFYDVRSPGYRALFDMLRENGCEIGLHASYNAYRSAEQLAGERTALQQASGTAIEGNRHHYFHLNPDAPHETLAMHEAAGLAYDSSLAFAYYPGFRRGTCHPFHVYLPDQRRELRMLQLPVAWMDDHFHRCLQRNRIADPELAATELLAAVKRVGGIATVDYHVRGMNADFFPQYGPWLAAFAERHLDSRLRYLTPREVAKQYAVYEQLLEARSRDFLQREAVALGTAHGAAVTADGVQQRRDSAAATCTVGLLQPHEHAAWDAFVEAHRHSTIYHTIAWKQVTEEGLGHRSTYLRALNSAGEIVGVLPLFTVRAIDGRSLVSVPLRDKGGPLVTSSEVAYSLAAAAGQLARTIGAKRVALKYPPDGHEAALTSAGFAEERHWVTTVVPVAMGEKKLWNDVFRSPTRRAVNKARNSGLVPRWSTDENDLQAFYRAFLMTRKKLGVPAYPYAFFRAAWRYLFAKGQLRLLLVEKDGVAQGALLVMPYKREVVSAYMGSNPDAKDARVNDLLFWEAIRWSSEAGYESFYFGADSPLQEGLLAYKRKWGGEQFAIPNYFYSTNGVVQRSADSSSPRYALTRKAISLMPTPIFRAFSSWAARKLW